MIPLFLMATLIPLLFGAAMVFIVWPQQKLFSWHFLVKVSIAVGLGFGVSSVIYFLWLLLFGPHNGFLIFETILLVCLGMALLYRMKRQKESTTLEITGETISIKDEKKFLYAFFYTVFGFSLFHFIRLSFFRPHGEWDAWSIWNLTARFIFRGAEHWRDAFSPLLVWYKPDYPLLIPLSITQGWKIIGSDTPVVPAAIALLFTFSMVLMILSSLTIFRSKTQGFLAALVLLSTPFFIKHGASQYADVPISFFFLASLVIFAFHDRLEKSNSHLLLLAGTAAGFSAWTKNEGFLFLIAIIAARSFSVVRAQGWRNCMRQMGLFFVGLIPIVLVSLYFKMYLAPQNNPNNLLLSQSLQATFDRLTDVSRYILIVKTYIGVGLTFTEGMVGVPVLTLYIFLVGVAEDTKGKVTLDTVFFTLLLMITGYFFTYVTSPHDLGWHLYSSLNRLFLQLWPMFIFYIFMKAQTYEEAIGKTKFKSVVGEKEIV